MSKIGIFFVTAALASSTAWAQQTSGPPAQHKGSERPAGVVTGGSADGGIALQSDSAKVDGSVSAVSGGVSVNARDNMRSQTPPHNIKMVFSLNTGNYVSDVHVKVTDRAGKAVIDDTSTGPWLFAKLPAGSYTATATYNGKAVTQKFSVGKSGVRTAQFRWPASVETQGVGSAGAEAGGQILGTGPQEPQQQ
jgi:hypothetical protein